MMHRLGPKRAMVATMGCAVIVMGVVSGCQRGRGPSAPPPVPLFDGTGTSRNDVAAIESLLAENGLAYATVRRGEVHRRDAGGRRPVGKGWAILVGVHPEAPATWRQGMTFATPVAVDRACAAVLVTAALLRRKSGAPSCGIG